MDEQRLPLVITLFETYGAGAEEIGQQVAADLGLAYHGRAFSSQLLEQAADGRQALPSQAMAILAGTEGPRAAADQNEADFVTENTETVLAAAHAGGVIVGRSATAVLARRPATLHVKLDAPVDVRLQRAAQHLGIPEGRAHARQRREDQVRGDVARQLYGWDPAETANFHLLLNTGMLPPSACTAAIIAASRSLASSETADSTPTS